MSSLSSFSCVEEQQKAKRFQASVDLTAAPTVKSTTFSISISTSRLFEFLFLHSESHGERTTDTTLPCGAPAAAVCSIPFGRLFEIYVRISNKLVGVLLRARKHGLVHFEGETLFQRRDDHVPVSLLRPSKDIRLESQVSLLGFSLQTANIHKLENIRNKTVPYFELQGRDDASRREEQGGLQVGRVHVKGTQGPTVALRNVPRGWRIRTSTRIQ